MALPPNGHPAGINTFYNMHNYPDHYDGLPGIVQEPAGERLASSPNQWFTGGMESSPDTHASTSLSGLSSISSTYTTVYTTPASTSRQNSGGWTAVNASTSNNTGDGTMETDADYEHGGYMENQEYESMVNGMVYTPTNHSARIPTASMLYGQEMDLGDPSIRETSVQSSNASESIWSPQASVESRTALYTPHQRNNRPTRRNRTPRERSQLQQNPSPALSHHQPNQALQAPETPPQRFIPKANSPFKNWRRERNQNLPPITWTPGDLVAERRGRNTNAARKSRDKKLDYVEGLERENERLNESFDKECERLRDELAVVGAERDYWKSVAESRGSAESV